MAALALGLLAVPAGAVSAFAQSIDFSHGGPVTVTSDGGIEWRQQSQEVIADQDAKAVRGNVTVTAEPACRPLSQEGGYGGRRAGGRAQAGAAPRVPRPRLRAARPTGSRGITRSICSKPSGNVHIFTPTDQAWGDHGAYDMDQAVLVMTGHNLKLTTPTYVVTARDSLEYWSNQHMAVARGDAVLVTNTARRIAADVLVAYTDPGNTAGTQPGGQPAPAAQTGCAQDQCGPDGGSLRSDRCLRQAQARRCDRPCRHHDRDRHRSG